MGNMSYCRFENTVSDLEDCAYHIHDHLGSEDEHDARKRLVDWCTRIYKETHDDDGHRVGIWIDEYDDEMEDDEQ